MTFGRLHCINAAALVELADPQQVTHVLQRLTRHFGLQDKHPDLGVPDSWQQAGFRERHLAGLEEQAAETAAEAHQVS